MTRETVGRWIAMWVPLLLLGCGRTPGQFFIVKNQVPQTGCVIPADVGALYRGQGTLDVSLVTDSARSAYLVFPLLENDLPGPASGQLTDGNRIALSGFEVDVGPLGTATPMIQAVFDGLAQDPAGAALLHYQVPWSGSVASGGGHTAATVEAFPAALARQIRDTKELKTGTHLEAQVRIRARGDTLHAGITSDDFLYPITVCDGCLIASLQRCPAMTAAANQGNFCNVAQDEPVDCCTSGGNLVCPASVAAQ